MSTRLSQYRHWRTESDGQWRWTLVAANGEPLASGEGYKTRGGVLRGIEAHRRASRIAVAVHVRGPLYRG